MIPEFGVGWISPTCYHQETYHHMTKRIRTYVRQYLEQELMTVKGLGSGKNALSSELSLDF